MNNELLTKIDILENENKQLKELCNKYEEEHKTTFEAWIKGQKVLTELEEELNIAYKELQPRELVIGQDILKNIQTIIQELKEKYK